MTTDTIFALSSGALPAAIAIVPELGAPLIRGMFGADPLIKAVAAIPGIGRAQLEALEEALGSA